MAEGIEKNIERLKKSKQYRGNTLLYSLAGVDNPSLYKLSNDNLKNKKDKKGRRDDGGIYIDWSKRQPMQRRNIDLLSVSKALPSEEVAYNFGDALEFDGVDDFVDLPPLSSGVDFTISFWFNATSIPLGNNNEFFGGKIPEFTLSRIQTFTDTGIRVRSGSANIVFTVPTMSAGAWNHLFITYNNSATTTRLYLNGTESSSGAQVGTQDFSEFVYLGRQTNDFYDGILDDLAIWEGVVGTSGNASDIYNGGAGADPSSVIASPNRWYKFNNNPNDSGTDGQNLTLNNFVADPYVAHV